MFNEFNLAIQSCFCLIGIHIEIFVLDGGPLAPFLESPIYDLTQTGDVVAGMNKPFKTRIV